MNPVARFLLVAGRNLASSEGNCSQQSCIRYNYSYLKRYFMRWLSNLVDQIIEQHPEGEILIESGASPSGTYHMGH